LDYHQEGRFKISHYLRFIPDELMLTLQYRLKMGKKLNLQKPQRYTEKLQWYKLYYRNPLMMQCADKYGVRDYVASKGLGNILKNQYAVYDDPEKINFDVLPNTFVIKTNNCCNTNIFCKDKSQISLINTKQSLHDWMNRDFYSFNREWAYKDITPQIIVEEYLEEKNNPFDSIHDYKFFCFNGEVQCILLDVDRFANHRRNFYDADWNYLDVTIANTNPNVGDCIPRPEGLAEMLQVATILAKDFPHVRVDLYWVNKKVYFGELTFYSASGYINFMPDEFDYELGEKFVLEQNY
jgi:hypothetical protein